MITLSYGGTAYTYPNLTEHPYGFDEVDVRRGRAARRWALSGIVNREDGATIAGLYAAWNAVRLLEDDPVRTGVVGATVSLAGTAPGFTWASAIPCWFATAPSIAMAGMFCRVSTTLVDATQALAILMRQGEEDAEQADQLNLGTLTFGGAVVNLTARPDGFADLPALALSPAGRHVITGPLVTTQTRRVEGWVTATNLSALETWLTTTTAASPATGAWFPTAWSEPVAKRRAEAGAIGTFYDVSFSVSRIR
jgi:hypothetical protein